MIQGIGVDIVNKKRIANILAKFPNMLPNKILSEAELIIYHTLAPLKKTCYLAKKFAAKEAFAKAYGTGIGAHISFRDISILNDTKGKPYISIANNSILLRQNNKFDISISDEKDTAIAFVVISS
jgi:holo-[acyl-carrier protein] synthase